MTRQGLSAINRKLGQLDTTLPGVFQANKKPKAGDPPASLGGGGAAHGDGYRQSMSSEDYRAARRSGAIK